MKPRKAVRKISPKKLAKNGGVMPQSCIVCGVALALPRRTTCGSECHSKSLNTSARRRKTPADNLWARVDRSGGPDACWPIRVSPAAGSSYGVASVGGRAVRAHRLAWELTNGPIPEGEGYHGTCVLHRCDNPPCCNPAHLFLGTQAENVADRDAKGRNPKSRVTHCPRGHEYTPENTYTGTGGRDCWTCRRARTREWNRRRSA